MTLFGLIVLILCFCLIVWVARNYIPAPFGNWIIIIAAVLLIIVLLTVSGLLGNINLHTRL